VKRKLRFLVIALTVATGAASLLAQEEKKETLSDKLKKLFVHPTPTSTPRKKHKGAGASPTVSPTETPISSASPPPPESATVVPSPSETTVPATTVTPTETRSPAETQYFDAVRPISPGPHTRPRAVAPKTTAAPEMSPTEIATPVPEDTPEQIPESRPMPSLPEMVESTSSPGEASNSLKNGEILDTANYPPEVRKIIELSLDLAGKNLSYKYASADPANGGMDCSGFIYYALTKSGINNVPRDAHDQYVWVRKAGNFQAVLAQRDDTFELDSLRPGDLLFWANNFGVSRDPEITQTMIYVGRDKATNQRLMIGASERGTFKGERKSGVGAFDFKLGSSEPKADEEATSVFVGYGRVPGLGGK
jgi:cell wall-associated NlpC family hydrolase